MSSAAYTHPPPPTAPNAVKIAPLTDAQSKLYDAVYAHVSADSYVIPDVEKGQLMEVEKFWLSYECLCRYIPAR